MGSCPDITIPLLISLNTGFRYTVLPGAPLLTEQKVCIFSFETLLYSIRTLFMRPNKRTKSLLGFFRTSFVNAVNMIFFPFALASRILFRQGKKKFHFWHRILLYSPAYSWASIVEICLPLPPKNWDSRCVLPHLVELVFDKIVAPLTFLHL